MIQAGLLQVKRRPAWRISAFLIEFTSVLDSTSSTPRYAGNVNRVISDARTVRPGNCQSRDRVGAVDAFLPGSRSAPDSAAQLSRFNLSTDCQ